MPFTKGHTYNLGKKHSKERIAKETAWHKDKEKAQEIYRRRAESLRGHKHTEETKKKISEIQKGKTINENQRKALATQWGEGINSPWWKGDKIGYTGKHHRIIAQLGSANHCENCGLDDEDRMYHWANKSGKYKMELNDWMSLCVSCHRLYDYGNMKAFNIKTKLVLKNKNVL